MLNALMVFRKTTDMPKGLSLHAIRFQFEFLILPNSPIYLEGFDVDPTLV